MRDLGEAVLCRVNKQDYDTGRGSGGEGLPVCHSWVDENHGLHVSRLLWARDDVGGLSVR